jgi:hypothetical protein
MTDSKPSSMFQAMVKYSKRLPRCAYTIGDQDIQ